MPGHNIAIIGAGPVGSIMAAYLARNGENIHLIDIKEDLISAINRNGITVMEKTGSFTSRVKETGNSAASLGRFHVDLIFIAVKFNFMDDLLGEIKQIFKPGQKIVIVQNGIDNEEKAAEKFSRKDVLRFVINYAGMHEEPGTVRMSFFNPPNYIGALVPETEKLAKKIASILTDAALETEFSTEIKKHEWKKTILNATMMPVCAATGLTMKEAISQEETRYLCEQILAEGIKVAARLGFIYEDNFFENGMAYLSKAGHHKPSTSLDLEAGNPIEYIFQPIIDYGKKTDTPTPFLESLTNVMRALEKQNIKRKS